MFLSWGVILLAALAAVLVIVAFVYTVQGLHWLAAKNPGGITVVIFVLLVIGIWLIGGVLGVL